MTTGLVAGLWDVLSCSNKEKYICKQIADGLVTTPAPPTTPALVCPKDWMTLLFRDFCVKVKQAYFHVEFCLNLILKQNKRLAYIFPRIRKTDFSFLAAF